MFIKRIFLFDLWYLYISIQFFKISLLSSYTGNMSQSLHFLSKMYATIYN